MVACLWVLCGQRLLFRNAGQQPRASVAIAVVAIVVDFAAAGLQPCMHVWREPHEPLVLVLLATSSQH